MRDSTDIANAIEQVNGIVAAQNAALQSVRSALATKGKGSGGGGINYGKPWVRPSNFPNYDYIDRTNEEALYLTYDCTVAKAFPDVPQHASFTIGRTAGVIEQGYVDSTGFHAETTYSTSDFSLNNDTVAIQLPTSGRDFVVFRITPSGSSHITAFSFINQTGANTGVIFTSQSCVEAWGRLPNATQWGYGWAYAGGATYWVESIDVIAPMLTSINLVNTNPCPENLKLSYTATKLQNAFRQNFGLKSTNVSEWNVNAVSNFIRMFAECYALVMLDLSEWSMSNAVDISYMFAQCANLISLDLHGWDVSKVKRMDSMFNGTAALRKIDLTGWNPSTVTTMNSLFAYSALSSIDLSGWETSNVTEAGGVFNSCGLLSNLNLTGWVLNAGTKTQNLFAYCSSLTDFYPGTFYVSYSLSDSPDLSLDSLARIITALPTVTTSQTLTLHATAKAKLTEEQIATANTKGWTIA